MSKTVFAIAVSLSLLACSGGSTSSNGPPPPTACKRTHRTGTYLLTWTEESGTCGKFDPSLVSLNEQSDGGARAAAGCQLHSDVWSDNDCKNERTLTCVTRVSDPAQFGGYGSLTNDAVGVTRQETADGSRIDGTVSMSIHGTDGYACNGTYAVVYVRQ